MKYENISGLLFGVGLNDLGSTSSCPYYSRWYAVLSRCYSENVHKKSPSYAGCSVCEDWKLFSNFKRWMQSEDWQGKDLDKDIINFGNKCYSPENCAFVDPMVNKCIIGIKRDYPKQKYMRGVRFLGGNHTVENKWAAYCQTTSIPELLGEFETEQEAHNAYAKTKANYIRTIAATQCQKVRDGLLAYAEIVESKVK